MRFALGEIKRAKLRFSLLIGAVALLIFLILFQQTLAGSLLGQFTGGLRHQSALVLVYNADARRSVDGSRVLPQQAAAVAEVRGVAETGPIGAGFVQREGGRWRARGHDDHRLRARRPRHTDDAVGRAPARVGRRSRRERSGLPDGYGIGARVTIVPGDTPITIVGLATDAAFNVQPTLFVSYATYEGIVRSTNPDAKGVLPNLVGVETAAGTAPASVAAAITAQVPGVEALDRETAVSSLPGVSSIQQSFAIILGLAFVVVILLTGFFFLIITVQKTASLTLLRAVGASSRFLLGGLLAQVVIVIGAALLVAIPLTILAVKGASSGGFTASVEPSVIVTTSIAIILLGIIASTAAMRRVVAIDPAAATARMTGGGLA